MKTILAVTLVMFSVRFGYTDFIKKCLTEDEYKKRNGYEIWYDHMSIDRDKAAEEYQIANMHELKYDMSLEKEARKMKSCDDFKHGVNYRVEDYGGKTSHPIWQGFVTSSVNKNTYLFMEEKHPLQTSFLHCDLTTPCLLDALRADNFANYTRSYIVLFGPRGTLSLSDFQHGPPGSKCTHGKTELDFCIAPPRSEMETSTPGSKIGITAPSRSEMETTGPSSENNGESEEVNSIFVYLCIAFMSLFL